MPADRLPRHPAAAVAPSRTRLLRESRSRRSSTLEARTGLSTRTATAFADREACAIAARLAGGHYEVPAAEIAARTRRSRRAAHARHVAIYIAHVTMGLPLRVVAAYFGRDRSTAAYACRVIEESRDDPAFDAALASLELSAALLLGRDRVESAA